MRVNIYAEELSDDVEIISKEIEGQTFTGLRFYTYLPVTVPRSKLSETGGSEGVQQIKGPFIHHPGDNDSAAITFWGKQDMRILLKKALDLLDEHYKKEYRKSY